MSFASLGAFDADFLVLLALFALCAAIGYSVVTFVRIILGERKLRYRLTNEIQPDQIHRFLQEMPHDHEVYLRAVAMLERQLALMPDTPHRRELQDALRQTTERRRRADAEKLLREVASNKELPSH